MTKIDLMKQVDKHNKQTKFEECEKKKVFQYVLKI